MDDQVREDVAVETVCLGGVHWDVRGAGLAVDVFEDGEGLAGDDDDGEGFVKVSGKGGEGGGVCGDGDAGIEGVDGGRRGFGAVTANVGVGYGEVGGKVGGEDGGGIVDCEGADAGQNEVFGGFGGESSHAEEEDVGGSHAEGKVMLESLGEEEMRFVEDGRV